jgi:hypothetical protein
VVWRASDLELGTASAAVALELELGTASAVASDLELGTASAAVAWDLDLGTASAAVAWDLELWRGTWSRDEAEERGGHQRATKAQPLHSPRRRQVLRHFRAADPTLLA